MTTKCAPCEDCMPLAWLVEHGYTMQQARNRGAYHEATYDDDMTPVWSCNNCGKITPRRSHGSRFRHTTPNATQVRRATRLLHDALRRHTHREDRPYEVKQESWGMTGGDLMVCFELGGKNDEGTLAATFCRYRYQLWIGRRGGLSAYNDKSKKVHGWKAELTYRS